jgi:alpha-D-ribose 1-methylphosphonate 5-triphosphate diphosphatase PhnM
MRAHKFASRYQNVANLKLTSTALYRLAGNRHRNSSIYTPEAIAAILAEAKEKRVDLAHADDIAMALRNQSNSEGTLPAGHKSESECELAAIKRTPALQPTMRAAGLSPKIRGRNRGAGDTHHEAERKFCWHHSG